MRGDRGGRRTRTGLNVAALAALGLLVGACSSGSLNNVLSAANNPPAQGTIGVPSAEVAAANNDTPCPDVQVRTGAATLMIGSKPGAGEPAPLDVRYQGSIINTARECHLNAGILTIKVGVEGRVITGPAGGPGTINVPLRIAVVQDGVNPKTVVTKLAIIPVTIANAIDRVTFTHVDSELAFPMPSQAGLIQSYTVYVGFDPLSAQQQKKPTRKRRAKPRR